MRDPSVLPSVGDADIAAVARLFADPARCAVLLALDDGRALPASVLAEEAGVSRSTASSHLTKLTEAGLLRRRNVGRSAMVQANPNNRLVEPLAEVLFLSWGPLQVVADEFSSLDGAERVLIFGSWAARYLQRPGPPPGDVDVLVVGGPTRESVYDAADRAERRLGMPVNPVIRAADAWRDAVDPLIQQIQSGPFAVVLVPDEATGEKPPATMRPGDD